MFITVVLPNFTKEPLTYRYEGESIIGFRVKVPFGKSHKVGVVIRETQDPDIAQEKIKPILSVLDQTPLLPQSHIRFLEGMARYYHHSLNTLVLSSIPSKLLDEDTSVDPEYLKRNGLGATLAQERILKQSESPISKFTLMEQCNASMVHSLIHQKLLIEAPKPLLKYTESLAALSDEQHSCLQTLLDNKSTTQLLWGCTGSGKTEIYAHLMHHTLKQGKQALLLVPEIVLTPQTVNKIAKRLGMDPLVFHSELSTKVRGQSWLKIRHMHGQVIIGTRSALLCPMPNLGCIIVDEEHSDSYRQTNDPFYSARDMAVYLGATLDIPVILGSATPSLESLYNAQLNRYQLVRLDTRFGGSHSDIAVIPLNKHEVLAEELIQKVTEELSQNKHVMLYIGKRGYSRISQCHHCGFQHRCIDCEQLLVSHTDQKMHCHRCGTKTEVLTDCPSCQQAELSHYGVGSQSVEALAQKLWPNTPCVRIDTDSMSAKACADTLQSLTDADATIIVGTQMITKGHDIPRLDLVIAMNSDNHLYSPDFRGEEHLFAELLQVAGRGGRRDTPGRLYIQSTSPKHHIFNTLSNPESGYTYLLEQRKSFNLPPYYYLACIFIRGTESKLGFINKLQLKALPETEVIGPILFPPGFRKKLKCYKILLVAPSRSLRTQQFKHILHYLNHFLPKGITLHYQIDSHLSL